MGGLYRGGLISGKIYSVENGWAYIGGGGVKPGRLKQQQFICTVLYNNKKLQIELSEYISDWTPEITMGANLVGCPQSSRVPGILRYM